MTTSIGSTGRRGRCAARARRPRTSSRRRSPRVLRKPRILRSEDDLGYLLRVLRNTFISTRRAAARRPQATAPPEALDMVEDRSSAQPEARLEAEEVYAAISALPDDFRDAVVAIDLIGLSYREAAQQPRRARGDDHDPASPRAPADRADAVGRDAAGGRAGAGLGRSRVGVRVGALRRGSAAAGASRRRAAAARRWETPTPDSTHVWPARRQVTTCRSPKREALELRAAQVVCVLACGSFSAGAVTIVYAIRCPPRE